VSSPARGLVSSDVELAAARLRAGGLVAMPTETVYGLAADAGNAEALARVFTVKGRPSGHPLIVHLASPDLLDGWVAEVPWTAEVLAARCWPGPLTLLLRRGPRVLDAVTGGRDTVGVRVPAHPIANELLVRFGGGLAAPSANRFGQVSPTTAEHVLADLGELLDPERDLILDGGASPIGVESTIVDCSTTPPQVLRPGAITPEQIAELLGAEAAGAAGPSRAAGMMPSHYAPAARVHLAQSAAAAVDIETFLIGAGHHVVVIDHTGDLVRYARVLYAELREADRSGATDVVAVLPPAAGLGHALRDRLAKAAGPR